MGTSHGSCFLKPAGSNLHEVPYSYYVYYASHLLSCYEEAATPTVGAVGDAGLALIMIPCR